MRLGFREWTLMPPLVLFTRAGGWAGERAGQTPEGRSVAGRHSLDGGALRRLFSVDLQLDEPVLHVLDEVLRNLPMHQLRTRTTARCAPSHRTGSTTMTRLCLITGLGLVAATGSELVKLSSRKN